MSYYPRDKYDDVPEASSGAGAHRDGVDQPKGLAGLNWIIIAAAIALGIGIISFLLLPQLRNTWSDDAGDSDDPAVVEEEEAEGSDEDSEDEDGEGAADDGDIDIDDEEADADGSSDDSGDSDESDDQDVDHSLDIGVYNSTTTDGLSAQGTEQLSGSDFNVVATGNWSGVPVEETTVYYSTADQEGTAEAIADELGATTRQSDSVNNIAVVLGPDYSG